MSTNRPTQGSAMSAADVLSVLIENFFRINYDRAPVSLTQRWKLARWLEPVITTREAESATLHAELTQLQAVVADVLGCGNVECSACRAALEAALGRAAATGEPASGDGADTAGTRVGGARR
jgi:hypothetical protein